VQLIFAFDDARDVQVSPSPESAAGHMEAFDVAIYTVYDQNGLRFEPVPDGYAVRLVPTSVNDRDDLVRRLSVVAERNLWEVSDDEGDLPAQMAERLAVVTKGRKWWQRSSE
jgi:hypothetical protein